MTAKPQLLMLPEIFNCIYLKDKYKIISLILVLKKKRIGVNFFTKSARLKQENC